MGQPSEILQDRLPFSPQELRLGQKLPGVRPLEQAEWLQVDEAYAGQMARRDALLSTQAETVHVMRPGALAACRELEPQVLEALAGMPGFAIRLDGAVQRPDGAVIQRDPEAPLRFLGQLLQEDLVILEKQGEEHVMTAAVLCFPASWTLAEKIGRPLTAIHTPVASYDAQLAKRVQRMFDVIRPAQPLMRHNLLFYKSPELHQPRSEGEPHRDTHPSFPYIRSERQCLLRLPHTQAVVFSIHTYVLKRGALTAEQAEVIPG